MRQELWAIPMSDTPKRRGRPKGTGINDDQTLQTISGLLAANAELKPTTAIRQAGISDPSVVRRLREKLKIVHSGEPVTPPVSAVTQSKPAAVARRERPARPRTSTLPSPTNTASRPQTRPVSTDQPAARLQSRPPLPQDTAAHISQVSSTLPQQASKTQTSGQAASIPPPSAAPQSAAPTAKAPSDPQLEALRLAAEAASAMSRLYLHCMNNAAQTSPLSLALSSQNMMTQWFATMMAGQIAAQRKPSKE